MRPASSVFAALLGVLGLIWIGQGLGYLKGSFMTGDPKWALIGAVLVLAAAAILGLALRRRGA